jgi:type 1 glutamine amidotransferase
MPVPFKLSRLFRLDRLFKGSERSRKRLAALAALGAGLVVVAATAVPSGATPSPGGDRAEGGRHFDALVFTRTTGFRHDSIPAGIAAIERMGQRHDFSVDATEDPATFNDADLAEYEVVIWLSTTGDVLDEEQQAAFERYIADGGGYVGIHAASDTEYDWAWYGGLVGAYFNGHPAQQEALVKVAGKGNISTSPLPRRWWRFDEWYNYDRNPRGDVRVLATLDERTYDPGDTGMGDDHPISWCHVYAGGRAWYTGMGHTEASYSERLFLAHVLGGIQQTAGVARFNCGAD